MAIDRATYLSVQANLIGFASIISEMPLEDVIAAIDQSDAVGPVLDPTLYREGSEQMQKYKEVVEAFKRVKDVWKRQVAETKKKLGIETPPSDPKPSN